MCARRSGRARRGCARSELSTSRQRKRKRAGEDGRTREQHGGGFFAAPGCPLLRKDRAAARADAAPVVEAQLPTADRAGGAAGPETLPETLDQGFQRRAHGADGSGRLESTSLLAPPDLRPGAHRREQCCTRGHLTLRNTPI